MKRIGVILICAAVLLSFSIVAVANTITIVVPAPIEEKIEYGEYTEYEAIIPIYEPQRHELFPVSVQEIHEDGRREIVRVYELNAYQNPADISREPFERDGFRFEVAEITRRETQKRTERTHTEVVRIYTQSNDFNTIMRELAETMYFEVDGYYGVLALDVSSINIQSRGTRSSSHNVTRTREFPHLSAPDTSLIPRTITEGNQTFNLQNVEWRTQSTTVVDYVEMPSTFTAVVTYSGTETRSSNIGFVTTAEFSGTLYRTTTGNTQFVVRFVGARTFGGQDWVGVALVSVLGIFLIFLLIKLIKSPKRIKKGTVQSLCVGLILCTLIGTAQIANAAAPGIPSNGFGRGQQAVHINPQTTNQTVAPSGGTPSVGAFTPIVTTYTYGQRVGRLTVERLGRTVNIYGGATMRNMDFGAAHFSFTGLNHGNSGLVGHNRGSNGFFSFVRHLQEGDIMTLYANGITRRYAVQRVFTINETDFTPLMQFGDNRLSLVTCVEYQPRLRRVAVAIEVQ